MKTAFKRFATLREENNSDSALVGMIKAIYVCAVHGGEWESFWLQ